MSPRVTVVTLGVSDLARSRRFYCDGLGFPASSASNERVVFIDAGGVVLGLHPRGLLAEDAHLPRLPWLPVERPEHRCPPRVAGDPPP